MKQKSVREMVGLSEQFKPHMKTMQSLFNRNAK